MDGAVHRARELFPRGLSQPDVGFRFSQDALLLAAFAGQYSVRGRVIDLGTGCGVVGLALALDHPAFFGVGFDAQSEMLVHAQDNARRLGCAQRFSFVRGNVAQPLGVHAESFDLAVCNPPYREPGRGRSCPETGKSNARFEELGRLDDFVRATAFVLRNQRWCAFVFLAERCDELLSCMRTWRLQPKEMLCIHPRTDAPAKLVLVRGRKNGGSGLRLGPPLFLHEGRGAESRLSAQAEAFCPRLRERRCEDLGAAKAD